MPKTNTVGALTYRLNQVLFTGALASVCVSPGVVAQQAGGSVADNTVLDEIVVTARKRGAETLQDISGSVQALTGATLEEIGANGLADYMRLVPNLGYNMSGSGQAQLQMRGVNTTRLNRFNANVPATVGVYFGETPLTASGYQPDGGVFDIARIEVLRGPQGTLFGASTMSGLMRIIPNDPEFEAFAVSGSFQGSYTEDGDPSGSASVAVNIPLTENFATRFTGYTVSNGGYIDNVFPFNGDENINSDSSFGVRAIALWTPSDALRIKGTYFHQQSKSDGRADAYIPFDPVAGIAIEAGGSFLLPEERLEQWQVSDDLQTSKIVPETFDDETWFAELHVDFEISDTLTLTSITSYSEREILDILDDTPRFRDFTLSAGGMCGDIRGACVGGNNEVPVKGVPNINDTELTRFSQDIRLSFRSGDRFSGVIGAYYEDDQRYFVSDLPIPGWDAWTLTDIGSYYGYVPPSVIEDSEGIDNTFHGIFDINTEQYAVYGEISFYTGDFELTVGGRYFDYDQDSFLDWAGWAQFGRDILDESFGEDGFNPKASVTYRPNDDTMMYMSSSKGFRIGGVAQVINPAFCEGELADLGIDGIPTTVESDSLWNHEVGFKSNLFNERTKIRAAAYHIDWEDARNSLNLQCGWIVEFSDLQVVSQCAEIEIDSALTENLTVSFGLGYTKSELDQDADSVNAPKGTPTPYTPELTMNAMFNYVRPNTFNGMDWFLRGDVTYVDEQYTELGENGPVERRVIPDSTVGNLYTGIGGDGWDLSLFVKNVSNELYFTGADFDRRQPFHYTVGRPRTVGVMFQFGL
ncbi:MAG: TonB-dependent receptor [Litorivicinaceae bacterium]